MRFNGVGWTEGMVDLSKIMRLFKAISVSLDAKQLDLAILRGHRAQTISPKLAAVRLRTGNGILNWNREDGGSKLTSKRP